jgi:glycosyltransferase involved in cell wall biosynthesis
MNPPLAIVIPAYKAKYLRETLVSIAAQTDRRFQLYLGDDASPEPLEEIVREFSGTLDIRYRRFAENLGGKSLVAQWNRCLELVTEPWLWLFADDDVMEPDCVAAFLTEMEHTAGQHDAYRFNTVVIQSARRFTEGGDRRPAEKPLHPQVQRGRDFLLAQLRGPHNCNMQQMIFSRAAWRRVGIPEFPLAWAADDAFIASLGEPLPIRTISGPRIRWRWSDDNITGADTPGLDRIKARSGNLFIAWAVEFLRRHGADEGETAPLAEAWYFQQLRQHETFLAGETLRDWRLLAHKLWQQPPRLVFSQAMAHNTELLVKKIRRKAGWLKNE